MNPAPEHYTAPAKWFHWLIVGLVGLELAVAAIMPRVYHVSSPDFLINIHMSMGVTILIVMILRLMWRVTHTPPPLPEGTARYAELAARAMHDLLYLLLFLIPFAGWAWASALGWPIVLYGFIPLPALLPAHSPYLFFAARAHVLLVGGILLLIGLHILAALYHWYAKGDGILERMLPRHPFITRHLDFLERLLR